MGELETMRSVGVALEPDDTRTVHVRVDVGRETVDVRFRASVPLFTARADAAVPLGLLPAMHAGVPLMVRGGISPVLAANSVVAQDILAAFTNNELTPAPVVADAARDAGTTGTGVGAFFSGGIDSFFTALLHEREITHLVFVRGWDILDVASPLAIAALDSARRAAGDLGKELIEVDTNVRDFTERFAPWSLAHGPVLGALALLLQRQLCRIFVPSSYSYSDLPPWGSHPLLDHLWGTESLAVDHDGCEFDRLEKVTGIATSVTALDHLRVCTKQSTTFNCGTCDKCIRTMVLLRLAGALDRAGTLPQTVSLRRVARLDLSPEQSSRGHRMLLVSAARERRDWPLLAALLTTVRLHPLLPLRRRLGEMRRARSRSGRNGRRAGPVRLRPAGSPPGP